MQSWKKRVDNEEDVKKNNPKFVKDAPITNVQIFYNCL
jgi:hypothetical protein